MLTTLAKVKQALGITVTTYDTLLTDYITQVSAYIETLCGGRHFEAVERTELYDYPNGENVFLKNWPINLPPDFDFTLSYRTGTIGTPIWVDYTVDDYLIYAGEGFVNMITAFGGSPFQPTGERQFLRAIYTGGFLIDWVNETDPTKHNLPADITSLATQLCMNLYNSSGEASGYKSESTEGQSVTYADVSTFTLTEGQKMIVARYQRLTV